MPGRPISLITEQVLTMRPRPRGIMRRATAWPTWNTLSRLLRISSCQSDSGKSWNGARRWMPALLTRMSMAPISRSIRLHQTWKRTGGSDWKVTVELGPKAEQIAFSLPAGQRSRPFRSAQGYVVLQCESVEKGTSPELDKVIAHALQEK